MAQKRLLRLPAVLEKTGKTITGWYQEVRERTAPQPVPIGRRTVAWLESEVDAWIEARVADRDSGASKRKGGPGRGHKGPREGEQVAA